MKDLQALRKKVLEHKHLFAREERSKELRYENYKRMVVQRIDNIGAIQRKIDTYSKDIAEYLLELEKLGVKIWLEPEKEKVKEEGKDAGELAEKPKMPEKAPDAEPLL